MISPASGDDAPEWARELRSQLVEFGVEPKRINNYFRGSELVVRARVSLRPKTAESLVYHLAEINIGTDVVSVEAADTVTSTLLRLRVAHA